MLNALLWNLIVTAVLAVLLFGACRMRWLHRRPALRCCLWLLVFAKMVTPPLFNVPLLPPVVSNQEPVPAEIGPLPGDKVEMLVDQESFPLEDFTLYSNNDHGYPIETEEMMAPSFETIETELGSEKLPKKAMVQPKVEVVQPEVSDEDKVATQIPYLKILFGISLTGTSLFWIVYVSGAMKLHRWLRRAGRADPELAAACEKVAATLSIRKAVRELVVKTQTTPLLWTWGEPIVAVPERLLEEMDSNQLQHIVAHELAHLLRRDHWANLFVFFVKSLLWWNPVVWWADREMRTAQELCCDAIAIDCCRANRRGYATTLLQALEFIQSEPPVSHALALRMGSKRSILRRFEMIGETRLTYRLSRWTFLALLVLAVPLVCMPVRGQEKTVEEKPAVEKPAATAVSEPEKEEEEPLDPKIRALGEAAKKRITTYSDEATLTLSDGKTGRMKVKKNLTSVAELLITAHLVEDGTQFELDGIDADGKVLTRSKTKSSVIPDGKDADMYLDGVFIADDRQVISKIQLTPKRSDDKTVTVKVKAHFTYAPTDKEEEAMLLIRGKTGKVRLDFKKLGRWIYQHQQRTGKYPKSLADLKQTLPKDVHSPSNEDYHYELQRTRYILSSCGKDGIYGNGDDEIRVVYHYQRKGDLGLRDKLYPLEEETNTQIEDAPEGRPEGNCSISGKVIDDETGEPIAAARVYLFNDKTYTPIFIHAASDGTFSFDNIPKGPFSLKTSSVPGYQNYTYNPENKPNSQPPYFSLNEGEHRKDLVFKLKKSCRISGKVVDENGEPPKFNMLNPVIVVAWHKEKDGKVHSLQQGLVNSDGSYFIDGIDSEPVYVMTINWGVSKKWDGYPPMYYPGTFFQEEAQKVTFDKEQSAKNIDITLKKEGGITVEGTVRDEAGKPIPETLVFAHHPGLYIDIVGTYTDEKGNYKLQCLGDGEYFIHADAIHRGFVAARDTVTLSQDNSQTKHDLTLTKGITISGKFVDEEGNEWNIGKSVGHASIIDDKQNRTNKDYRASGFGNKYNKMHSGLEGMPVVEGPGSHPMAQMGFPTESTFLFQAMPSGRTKIEFSVKKEGQTVKKILYNGKDITTSGFETQPGENVKDITIVVGNAKDEASSETEVVDVVVKGNTSIVTVKKKDPDPKEEEKPEAAKPAKPQKESTRGPRPHGDCSISGKVVDAKTGRPIGDARVYLFYIKTFAPIFINTASDGTFHFKDLPEGPFSLQTSHVPGYQDDSYDPEGKSGQFPQFSLKKKEQRAGIVFKLKPAFRITGKVLDEKGRVPKHINTLNILAWTQGNAVDPESESYKIHSRGKIDRKDGSYTIDGLDGSPVYVMAIDWQEAQKGHGYPPIYYPSTFSRNEAKRITFDKKGLVNNIDITLRKEGGLALEGTVLDEDGKPIPETLVVAHRPDMLFDLVTGYTDKEGKYRIDGLGEGKFQVHFDATHRGFVMTRMPIDIDNEKPSKLDITLKKGVTISGKLVDEKGKKWEIGTSYGHAFTVKDKNHPVSENFETGSFCLTGFWNRHHPKNLHSIRSGLSLARGQGDYHNSQMLFPTKGVFLFQGIMPGHTKINFTPKKEGQKVLQILHNGKNILTSGIETRPGEEIKDITIVIGNEEKKNASDE